MNEYTRRVLLNRMRERTNQTVPDERRIDKEYYDARYGMQPHDGRRDMVNSQDFGNYNIRGTYDGMQGVMDKSYQNDYHMKLHLTKSDMHDWKSKMKNADGTTGEYFQKRQVLQAAEKLGIRFTEFTEQEFCTAVNFIYSDFGEVIKKYVGSEKELYMCADLAEAFLEDADGPEASEKLALYYFCIVCHNAL